MMLARRMLLVRPALYLSAQARTIGFAPIALAARKTPPPPAKKKTATAKKASTTAASKTTTKKAATAKKAGTTLASKRTTRKTATRKATISKKAGITRSSKTTTKRTATASRAPIRRRLTDREKATRERAREREKVARAKRLERAKVIRAKRLEREKVAKEKARERQKVARARAKEKVAQAKEKRREMKERAREREKARKEREKLKAERAKALKKPYPPPPKQPASGFLLFAHDPKVNRDRGVGPSDGSKAGAAWKALSDAEREAYNKKYEKARAQWKEDVAKWVSSLNFAQLIAARANREPGTYDKSSLKTLPKRPANAYGMFIAEANKRPDIRNKVEVLAKKEAGGDDTKLPKIRFELFGRTLGDTWKSMTEKEKAVYAAKSADAKKQWEKNYGSILAAQKEALVSAHT